MLTNKSLRKYLPKLLLLFFLLLTNIAIAQTHTEPKLEKGGKFKQKKAKVIDHNKKEKKRNSNHKVEWNKHSQSENNSFSKKKRKNK